MRLTTILLSLLSLTLATLTLLPRDASGPAPTITANMITAIAPKSASCANPPKAGQCLTAQQIADWDVNLTAKWFNVTSKGEIAAALGTMAFESAEFKYNHNAFPGRPGQGTRNMQMPTFNAQYATYLAGRDAGFKTALAAINAQDVDALLGFINLYPRADLGSAFWFIATQADCQGVRQGLQAGTVAGWQAYVKTCVGTDPSEAGRQGYWEAACKALGC